LFIFLLVELGFEHLASCLLLRHSTTSATLQPPLFFLCVGYFQDSLENCLSRLALNHNPPDFCLLST
jgi:hypothetical protein